MILAKYLVKEVMQVMLAVVGLLMLIFLSQRLILYITDASMGRIGTDVIIHLLGLQAPTLLSLLMPMAFFLAVLVALGRLCAEHEMDAMKACGFGEQQLLKLMLWPAIILSCAVALMSLWWGPSTAKAQYDIFEEQAGRAEITLITPGVFREHQDDKGVVYVGSQDEQGHLQNVFIMRKDAKNEELLNMIIADQGRLAVSEDGSAYDMVLSNGQQLQGQPGTANFVKTEFAEYRTFWQGKLNANIERKIKARSTLELWQSQDGESQAELQWRIALPFTVIILLIIAIPFAMVRPRQGKFAKILPGVLLYLLYMALLVVGKSWVERGKLPFIPGLWLFHGVFLAVAIYQWRKSLPQKNKNDQVVNEKKVP